MAKADGYVIYLGEYEDNASAVVDFDAIKELKHEKFIGDYESALFQKTADGKVVVHNTDATERGFGAKAGAITGAVIGVLFPATIVAGAIAGGGLGALVGHFKRGMKTDDIKELADMLEPGHYGVVVIAETTVEEGLDRMMKRAAKVMKKEIDLQADEMKKAIDEAAEQG